MQGRRFHIVTAVFRPTVDPPQSAIPPVQHGTNRAEKGAAGGRAAPTTITRFAMTTPDPPVPADGKQEGGADRPTPMNRWIASAHCGAPGWVASTPTGWPVLIGATVATLALLVVVFTVVGVHQNQQDDRLHNQGVPVTFTVSGCLGLLGGSGSNAAGYSCRGSYTLDGHRYSERLPGNDLHPPGTSVAAIAVPGDPALVAPEAMVRTEHSSNGVFLVPLILFVILALLVRAAVHSLAPASG